MGRRSFFVKIPHFFHVTQIHFFQKKSVSVFNDQVFAGQKGVVKIWNIDKLVQQSEQVSFSEASKKTATAKNYYMPKGIRMRESCEVTRGIPFVSRTFFCIL